MKTRNGKTAAKMLTLLAIAAGLVAVTRPGPRSPLVGRPLGTLELPLYGGGAWSATEARGSVLLLNFMAVWCPPCNVESAEIERHLHRQWPEEQVRIVSIHLGEQPDEVIDEFRRKQGVTYPMAIDADQSAMRAIFGNLDLPQTLIVDRDGTIVAHSVGYGAGDWRAWKARIDRLLDSGK